MKLRTQNPKRGMRNARWVMRELHRERGSGIQRLLCEVAVAILLVVVIVSSVHGNNVGVIVSGLPLLVGVGWLSSRQVRRRLERGMKWFNRWGWVVDLVDFVWHLVAGAIALGALIWSAVKQ